LHQLLDSELNRLPAKYRTPLILCGLEGKTEKEAAGQLGLAQGTLSSRLSRARAMLARRLARRGVALSLPAASANVSTALFDSTIKAASQFAAGQATTTGLISGDVTALTEGVLTAMFLSQLKVAMGVLLVAVTIVSGAGVLVSQASGPDDQQGRGSQQKKVASPTETPKETAEQQILKLENELAEITKRRDLPALRRILTDDLSFIGGFGALRDRESYLSMIADIPYKSYTKDELKVRVYGNTAITTGRIIEKYEKQPDIQYRFTSVYVKQNGRWRQVAMQFTKTD
jgi:hypothetical protein